MSYQNLQLQKINSDIEAIRSAVKHGGVHGVHIAISTQLKQDHMRLFVLGDLSIDTEKFIQFVFNKLCDEQIIHVNFATRKSFTTTALLACKFCKTFHDSDIFVNFDMKMFSIHRVKSTSGDIMPSRIDQYISRLETQQHCDTMC
jgi:hypothetical protein